METLRNGQRLNMGDKLFSADGNYFLLMQGDGNLVLYDKNNKDHWATNVVGKYAIMQGDGNFVVYNQQDRPVWASNTFEHPNSHLILQNDGNLVIYQNENSAIWASNTSKDSFTIHNDIVTAGLDAFGGWVEVTINRSGNVRFKGHCHDAGFEDYDFHIRVVVHGDSPIVLAMQKTGSVEGTESELNIFGDSAKRDFDWDETTFHENVASRFDEVIKNIKMDVYSSNDGNISGALEDIADFAIKWIAGSILVTPLSGMVIFVGVEIGAVIAGAGFAGGARIIGTTLWLAGPYGTLYAIAAEGMASVGTNERQLTDDEYNFANTNIFKGTLPAKEDIRLTDTIGGTARAFTMPRFDSKITINMGSDGYRDPLNFNLNFGQQKGQIFIHELTHAWQIKNTNWEISLLASALASRICELGGGHPYDFGTDKTKPFGDFNLEQQASIVDYWFTTCEKDLDGNIKADNILSTLYHYIEGNIRVGKP